MCSLEPKAEVAGEILSGREIAWYVKDFFHLSAEHGTVLKLRDLLQVELRNNNLKQYMLDWESIITRIKKMRTSDILEDLFLRQLEKTDQLKGMSDLYQLGITQNQRLVGMVKARLEERRQKKNRDEYSQGGSRKPRTASPAPARGRNTSPGKKGRCMQYSKSGTCSRGNTCPYKHERGASARGDSPRAKSPKSKKGKRKKGKAKARALR